MLLVADDANAAYSNPRELTKRADSLPIIAPAYRTGGPHSAVTSSAPARIIQTALAPLVGTLTSITWHIGVRTSPARPRTGGTQAPRQSPPGVGQGNAGSWADGAQASGYGNGDYASDGSGYGYQGGDGYGGYPQQEQGQYGQPYVDRLQPPYGEPGGYDQPAGYGQPADYGYQPSAGLTPGTASKITSGPPEPGYDAPGSGQGYPGSGQGYEAPNDVYGQQRRLLGHGTADPATPRCPMAATATRVATPATTGTAGSPPPRPAPASPTPARTR